MTSKRKFVSVDAIKTMTIDQIHTLCYSEIKAKKAKIVVDTHHNEETHNDSEYYVQTQPLLEIIRDLKNNDVKKITCTELIKSYNEKTNKKHRLTRPKLIKWLKTRYVVKCEKRKQVVIFQS
jgi:deoxycytidylate deaminase